MVLIVIKPVLAVQFRDELFDVSRRRLLNLLTHRHIQTSRLLGRGDQINRDDREVVAHATKAATPQHRRRGATISG